MEIFILTAIVAPLLWGAAYLMGHSHTTKSHRESVRRKAELKSLYKDAEPLIPEREREF